MTIIKLKAKKENNKVLHEKKQRNETNYLVYAELKVVERVEGGSPVRQRVVCVGRATALCSTTYGVVEHTFLRVEHTTVGICIWSDTI